jgi:hypothetical protein
MSLVFLIAIFVMVEIFFGRGGNFGVLVSGLLMLLVLLSGLVVRNSLGSLVLLLGRARVSLFLGNVNFLIGRRGVYLCLMGRLL